MSSSKFFIFYFKNKISGSHLAISEVFTFQNISNNFKLAQYKSSISSNFEKFREKIDILLEF